MGIRLKEALRGVAVATLLAAGACAGVACGGDDSSSGGSSTSGGVDSGTQPQDSGGGNQDTGTTPVDSGAPDTGNPDTGPPPEAVGTPVFNPLPTAGPFTSSVPGGVQITTTPTDATIFFTTNGTNPTTASTVYSGPISVTSTTTIRAFATKTGFSPSQVAAGTFVINPPAAGQLSDVTVTPSTGTYPNPQSVGMTIPAAEAPATICYTLDGATPTCTSNPDPNFATPATCTGTTATYSAGAPLQVDAPTGGGSTTVKAIACKNGQKTSVGVTSSVLSFKAAKPTASVPPAVDVPDTTTREVPQNTLFTLSTATLGGGTSIHYRTDGINPNCIAVANTTPSQTGAGEQSCGANTSACLINIDKNYTFKAIACKLNYQASDMATFNFAVRVKPPTLDSNTAATPYFNDHAVVAGDAVSAGQVASTWRCYSTGASPVLCGATVNACTSGSSTIPTVTVNNTTINVDNCAAGFTSSASPALPGSGTNGVVSGGYFLKVAPVSVNPSPGGGIYSNPSVGGGPTVSGNYWDNGNPTSFTLDTATNNSAGPVNVQIHYTVNGAQPTCASGTVIGKGGAVAPSPLNPFSTIRAIACKTNYVDSDNRVLSYQDPAAKPSLTLVTTPSLINGVQTGPNYTNNVAIVMTADPPATGPAPVTNICYTVGQPPLGGSIPDPDCSPVTGACTAGSLYNPAAPFTVDTTGFQVKAIACKTGVPQKSDPVEGVYTFKMGAPFITDAAPNCSPAIPGCGNTLANGSPYAYNSNLYFHTGSEPSKSGNIQYRFSTGANPNPTCSTGTIATSDNFLPPNNQPFTYNVIACDVTNNFLPSDVVHLSYSAYLTDPTFSPTGQTTNNLISTTVSSTSAAAAGGYLCYTTDGSAPACVGGGTCTGTLLANGGSVNITTDPTTVRAVSCRPTGFTQSGISSSGQFRLIVDDPTITPAGSPPNQTVPVTVGITNNATIGATVCWSTDGSSIDSSCSASASVICQAAVGASTALTTLPPPNKATNFTLHVRACKAGFASTADIVRNYSFSPYTRTIVIDGLDDWSLNENGLDTETVDNGYLAWDPTYVYFGWRGASLTNSTARYFGIYLRSPTGPYTLTRDDRLGADHFGQYTPGVQWGMMPQPIGGVDFHFFVRTDRNENPGVSHWDGANWVDGAALAPITCAYGGQLGNANALIECRVTRASVGLSAVNAVLNLNGVITDDGVGTPHNEFPFTAAGHSYYSGDMGVNIPSDKSRWLPGVLP